MPLDPTTPANDDHYHFDDPPVPEAARRTGSRNPVTESGDEPIRTLLCTAATHRPLEEVAALVMLLKRTGEVPNPGDEALRVAAVARPVDEVMQLVAMLNEPPHDVDEADTTLRAAAVGRPIEEVAQLVSYLGTHENEPAFATAHRLPERAKPTPEATPERPAPERPAPERAKPERRPEPTLFGRPDEHAPRTDPRTEPHAAYAGAAAPAAPAGPTTAAVPAAPAGPAEDVNRGGHADQLRNFGHVARDTEPGHGAPRTGAPAGPPPEVPRLAPAAGRRPAAGSRDRTASANLRSPLRSPLRRPAAAALFACGVIHLPTDFAVMRSGGYADAVALAVTLLCLVFGLWLAVADTARIWAASAATAVGIIAAHTLSGLGTVDLLRSSLGADFGWASLVAVGCAAVALMLAGTALMLRQRTGRRTARRAPRRSTPAAGAVNDA
ncbi:hypothetical protein [Streptomyces sp. NBC_01508]|uniref:hypothetical protein n=1 Tax=Streptomyces sp. NBC_01508 TaxID=2903888 RepID=UPI00386D3510